MLNITVEVEKVNKLIQKEKYMLEWLTEMIELNQSDISQRIKKTEGNITALKELKQSLLEE